MGFLKNFNLIFLILTLFLVGCSKSIIKLDLTSREEVIPMFGKIPERNFVYPEVGEIDTLTEKWEYELTGSFNSTSISVFENYGFVNDLSGRVYCINLNTGKGSGVLKLKNPIMGTPILNKNILIYVETFGDENKSILTFYDFENGKLKDNAQIKGRILNEILKVYNAIVLVTENGIAYKYDLNGIKIWETKIESFVHSSPAANDELMVFGDDKGEVIGVELSTGRIRFKNKVGSSFFSGTSISENKFYIADDKGIVYCFNLIDGKEIWKYNTGAKISTFPIVYDDAVYIGNLSGTFYKISSEGKLIWKTNTMGVLNSTPLLAGNNLIVPDMDEKFYLVNAKDGKIKNTYTTETRIRISPIIYKNMLILGIDRGVVKAYEISK